jgi:multiple sugar transport system ATP-binding protein
VLIGGSSIDHLRPHERRVAMVFQSYALYPHMSVRGNLSLPLVMSRLRLH